MLKIVDDDRNEEYREKENNATVQENPKKNLLTNESDKMLEVEEKTKDDKINENVKHDCNKESYHIEEVSMKTLENEINQQLLNDKKYIIDDDADSEDDDRSYISTDSLGLTSDEREEYEFLHRKMNQKEGSEEGSDVSDDIPLVPLELLDEVEEKL